MVSQFASLREKFGEDMLHSLPLFLDRHGMVATKATVILALEATVRGYGGPTVGANGTRLHEDIRSESLERRSWPLLVSRSSR